jgi:hypothetical protein
MTARKWAMDKNRFWGVVSSVAATPVGLAAGVAKGSYDAVSGNGPFEEGFSKTAGTVIRAANDFGEEHGGLITTGIVGGAAAAVGRRIIDVGLRLPRR